MRARVVESWARTSASRAEPAGKAPRTRSDVAGFFEQGPLAFEEIGAGGARVLAADAVFLEGAAVDFVAPRVVRLVRAAAAAFLAGCAQEGGRGVRNFCADTARFAQRLRTR